MNREIKFRGKCLDNGEWVYGDLNHGISYTADGAKRDYRIGPVGNFYSVDPNTVGQYSGLHNGDSEAIYEGDVVQFYDEFECKRITALVIWNKDFCSFDCAIGGEPVCGLSSAIVEFNDFELLGNIFDHPELLTLSSEQK